MSPAREKLLTASDLASLCQVDLKTIHNWVDRGRIAHFRTPGRHLRFRAADAAAFLQTWGYSVPRELTKLGARSILVIGPSELRALVERMAGDGATLRHATHPYDALILAGADAPDAYVIDVETVASQIDVVALIEALRRATPAAVFAAMTDDAATVLPAFVQRVAHADASALRAWIAPVAASPHDPPALAG